MTTIMKVDDNYSDDKNNINNDYDHWLMIDEYDEDDGDDDGDDDWRWLRMIMIDDKLTYNRL